jgi:hypothetical protein
MKKYLQSPIIILLFLVVSCSVSEEEKAAEIQRHRDSVAAAEAMIRAAQQAMETRNNARGTINLEAQKIDSILKKDSLQHTIKDTIAKVKTDTVKVKKVVVAKTKSDSKSIDKKAIDKKPNTIKKVSKPAQNQGKTTTKKK